MTRWPYGLAEAALYALLAGLAIGMWLDARARFRQLRQRTDAAAGPDADHDRGDGAEISTVRRKLDHDEEPPPAA